MKYRTLGRTGLRISEVSLGGHEYRRRHLVKDGRFTELDPNRPKIIATAIEMGVNYFDTTYTEEAQSLGATLKTLGVQRDKVYLSGMSIDLLARLGDREPSEWKAYIVSEVEERLNLFHSDYVDVFQICAMESGFSQDRLEFALETLRNMQQQGKIRWVGSSAHNPELLAKVIDEQNPIDMCQTPINFNKGVCEPLLNAVRKHNVGLIAIKPFVWFDYGMPFLPVCQKIIDDHGLNRATAAQMAIRWILSHEEIAAIVPGCNSEAEVIENARASDLPPDCIDFSLLSACRDIPDRIEEMIDLIDHPHAEVASYSHERVANAVGCDYGKDKEKYLEAWRAKRQKE
jgi:aryl-alcohol dehydrogenase-like predicted oxidoreductase